MTLAIAKPRIRLCGDGIWACVSGVPGGVPPFRFAYGYSPKEAYDEWAG